MTMVLMLRSSLFHFVHHVLRDLHHPGVGRLPAIIPRAPDPARWTVKSISPPTGGGIEDKTIGIFDVVVSSDKLTVFSTLLVFPGWPFIKVRRTKSELL